MERWAGRVALVTGASAGIGAALCARLVKHGVKVVGCARNADRIQVSRYKSLYVVFHVIVKLPLYVHVQCNVVRNRK